MKDWILYNWKLIPWAIFITVSCFGLLLFSLQRDKNNPQHDKVRDYCLELVRKVEGIEIDPFKAISVPIGATVKHGSYSGIMMVWEKETSGISVKCSIVSHGERIRYFAVNGEDKTDLVRREERKE